MTEEELKAIVEGMTDAIALHVAGRITAAIAPLTERIKALEAKPSFEDQGVFVDGKTYQKGHGVTCGGHYWIAQVATALRPDEQRPDSARAWRLVVRRGKDGKPGRDAVNA